MAGCHARVGRGCVAATLTHDSTRTHDTNGFVKGNATTRPLPVGNRSKQGVLFELYRRGGGCYRSDAGKCSTKTLAARLFGDRPRYAFRRMFRGHRSETCCGIPRRVSGKTRRPGSGIASRCFGKSVGLSSEIKTFGMFDAGGFTITPEGILTRPGSNVWPGVELVGVHRRHFPGQASRHQPP